MRFDEKGLTSEEALQKLKQYGANVLPETPPPSDLSILFSQLKSPLVYVLLAAGIITILLRHPQDAVIIFAAVLINTIFGFVQESRAGKALQALKKLVQPHATVIRDGEMMKVPVMSVVIGDVVVLAQGDKVSADGILLQANRLFLNESMLTGESMHVGKQKDDKIFMGTIVTAGQGLMKVMYTGSDTQIGSIAQSVGEVSFDTPLRRQLNAFSKQLVIIALVLTSTVFLIGLVQGRGVIDIFTTSVALAVSSIPEGLLVTLTVVLAVGMKRILASKGLVRNLSSAETLGGVTVICADKTGTLTQGIMQVAKVIGSEKELATHVVLANDLDDPMVIAAHDWAKNTLNHDASTLTKLLEDNPRLDSIPFSSEKRFFVALLKSSKSNTLYFSGAPEMILQWCKLSVKEKQKIELQMKKLTEEGYRLIGYANVTTKEKSIGKKLPTKGLNWVGCLAFLDPVRTGVKEALDKTKQAGVSLIVITGDYPQTAAHVMRQLGLDISSEQIIVGSELEAMDVDTLEAEIARGVKLFARTTPDQKLKIIEVLKKRGEIVAMMGDGVNDAPALAKADIGIVVESASDVAKESSDIILLDSSFATIVAAIEEGRGIFDNIRKIILYLLCDGFGEITAVLLSLFIGLPLPVTAVQILWINIISDGFPSLALTVDPKRDTVMRERPRKTSEMLVSPWMRILIALVSLTTGIGAFLLFRFVYANTGDLVLARSAAFASLGVNSLIYVFSVRNLTEPLWRGDLLRNKWLVLAVLAGVVLHLSPFVLPSFGGYLGVRPLPGVLWAAVAVIGVTMLFVIETSKLAIRKKAS